MRDGSLQPGVACDAFQLLGGGSPALFPDDAGGKISFGRALRSIVPRLKCRRSGRGASRVQLYTVPASALPPKLIFKPAQGMQVHTPVEPEGPPQCGYNAKSRTGRCIGSAYWKERGGWSKRCTACAAAKSRVRRKSKEKRRDKG